jgi:tRNA-specific 2-thiouridylase
VLSQAQLRHALFPLGEYTKRQVREMAAARGLPVASKAESQELCFVAKNDYRGFVRRYAETTGRVAPSAGPIYDVDGHTLGQHEGLAYYTVGQRKGLGVSAREPLHVLQLDSARNALVVGSAALLERDKLTVTGVLYSSGEAPNAPFAARVKVRYKAAAVPGWVTPRGEGRAEVRLEQPQRAVTPGQAAVFYDAATGDTVLGGGLIE